MQQIPISIKSDNFAVRQGAEMGTVLVYGHISTPQYYTKLAFLKPQSANTL